MQKMFRYILPLITLLIGVVYINILFPYIEKSKVGEGILNSIPLLALLFAFFQFSYTFLTKIKILSSKVFVKIEDFKLVVENQTDYPIRDLIIFNNYDRILVPIILLDSYNANLSKIQYNESEHVRIGDAALLKATKQYKRELSVLKIKYLFSGRYYLNASPIVSNQNELTLLTYTFIDYFGNRWLKKPYKDFKLVSRYYALFAYFKLFIKYGHKIKESHAEPIRMV